MRKAIIRSASSSFFAVAGISFLLIFIAGMKHPLMNDQSSVEKTYSYLALGDSYTIGEKVTRPENFPNQLASGLRERGINCRVPKIIAKTGWTTDELETGISQSRLRRKYDLVTLLIGVNDQYRGRPVVDYIPRFEALLKKAIAFAGDKPSHVVVFSIPDWGVTPFAQGRDRNLIASEIDAFNAANELVSRKYGVHYISITQGSRRASDDVELLTTDGLHPSGKMYAQWTADALPYIMKELH
ncbi:SGNH/GDSL hydrolase family protein [Terrimonas ferruginea]|uniref:SGNH/GDSL hydrolase family protein n=1 Tax=Terrimonas ferruginea TaxID=249 RepID=UPI001FDFB1D3|nr:SGNH/GDSL hydrolase family protein [Terrimonas ferruginea]